MNIMISDSNIILANLIKIYVALVVLKKVGNIVPHFLAINSVSHLFYNSLYLALQFALSDMYDKFC